MLIYHVLGRDFVSVLVFCFGHVEYRPYSEDGRGENENENYNIGTVMSRTDSLSSAKRHGLDSSGSSLAHSPKWPVRNDLSFHNNPAFK